MKKIILMLFILTFFLAPNSVCALTQTEVSQLYVSILGRASEGAGNTYWQADPSSTSMTVTANVMLDTEAAVAYFGSTLDDNQSFIEHIYINTLGKTYAEDPEGIHFWVSELDSGKSKGEVIAALISAAQYPVNAGAAQDRFNNRVEASNYCADMIEAYTDLDTFIGFINGVTDDDATLSMAIELINLQPPAITFSTIIPVIGATFVSGRSVQQTLDEGYIIVGTTGSCLAGDSYMFLLKTNNRGDETWHKTFDNGRCGGGSSVQQTMDGGYIIAGGGDTNLTKTDSNGNEIWSSSFGGPTGVSVQQTIDGGYIITGLTYTNSHSDVYLIKTDNNGNETWSKTFGRVDSFDSGGFVQQTTDGGYIIVGTTALIGSNGGDVYMIKTDSKGEHIWSKTFGRMDSDDDGYSVQQTFDGGYIIVGSSSSAEDVDVYLIKTDNSGNETWSKTFGGMDSRDYGASVQQTIDGGYNITGLTSTNSHMDVYLIKTDNSGNETWSKTFGGMDSVNYGESVQQTLDGGYIITGGAQDGSGDRNVYLIKTDSNGNIDEE